VISGFGTKPDGGHNDGINVAVPQGTPVKAAENGVVAYSGSELKGYGNLVLVRHANNWVSAYAHNNELLVKRGEKVRRGQVIAKAGATGSVSQPQVHFELRKGSRPIDPTKFMNSMTANAD
jgi:murein DD-endopeptidase MepM/ murein hydrolase activator NlpD